MPIRDYPTAGVTVHWDADVCIHSAVCVRSLPTVFRPTERPWITPDEADAERIVETIGRCPSGALTYTRSHADGSTADPRTPPQQEETHVTSPLDPTAPDVTVTVTQDGPYDVIGPVRIVASDGVTIKEGEKLWLCRCGHSNAKPFCDGSHRKAGFTDSGLGAKREKEGAGRDGQ